MGSADSSGRNGTTGARSGSGSACPLRIAHGSQRAFWRRRGRMRGTSGIGRSTCVSSWILKGRCFRGTRLMGRIRIMRGLRFRGQSQRQVKRQKAKGKSQSAAGLGWGDQMGVGIQDSIRYFVGLDLGQRQDHSALAVVERDEILLDEMDYA